MTGDQPVAEGAFRRVEASQERAPGLSDNGYGRSKPDNTKVKNKNQRIMANHKSSKKRIRQTATKRAHNRLFHKTARNAVKALRSTTEKSAAEALLPKVTAMLDKLSKHNIMHKNKAANLKSAIQLHVNSL